VGWCRRRGWTVVARNWRCRGGELDVVAWDQEQLIVVEVKCRSSVRYGVAGTQLTAAQRRRIERTLEQFCYRTGLGERPWRMDLLALQRRGGRWYSTHYGGADC
jgi:putative endonuclease